jgi:predicted secreted Zn-dependent protease
MAKGQRLVRRKWRRRPQDEERVTGHVAPRSVSPNTPQARVAQLQRQVGNRAVQHLLAQREVKEESGQKPAPTDEKVEKAPVTLGQIKIERPKIEYYEVSGNTLLDVSKQVLEGGEWYEYEYDYDVKSKKGIVTQVDVTVSPTLRLPRWRGPGWEQASDREKVEWQRLLSVMEVPSEKFEDETELPAVWLDPNWEVVPDTIKGEWRAMLQSMQGKEKGYIDVIHRRALVLQQRMLGRPDGQVTEIFDQFLKDLKVEREKYDRQTKFGVKKKISLEASAMVQ